MVDEVTVAQDFNYIEIEESRNVVIFAGIYAEVQQHQPLAAPSNLQCHVISTTQINLTWEDNSIDELGFKIERAPTASGAWTQIATVPANTTFYEDIGLTPNTQYCYRVRAYKSL
ncbi:MAG: fibronectin type III domain-containing protein [Planctomycetota bacterium]|jgi:hypothetical protein